MTGPASTTAGASAAAVVDPAVAAIAAVAAVAATAADCRVRAYFRLSSQYAPLPSKKFILNDTDLKGTPAPQYLLVAEVDCVQMSGGSTTDIDHCFTMSGFNESQRLPCAEFLGIKGTARELEIKTAENACYTFALPHCWHRRHEDAQQQSSSAFSYTLS